MPTIKIQSPPPGLKTEVIASRCKTEAVFQAGYIEKYGTGITENIRLMRDAHLLDLEIDLSAEFVTTTVWHPNLASNLASLELDIASNLASSRLQLHYPVVLLHL